MAATATAEKAKVGGGKAAPPPPRPFRIGVKSHEEINFDETRALGAGTTDYPVLEIPPAGFLRGVYILVEATSATNAATVAFAGSDAPWSALDSVTLEDTNSKPIVGPINGFDLFLINKYGGYTFSSDPEQSVIYTATTGTTTPATFSYCLRIPVELASRDALGSLPNKSGTNKFKVRIRLAASTTVYSTPPTNAVNVRIRMVQEDWWEPDPTDLKGRPLAQNPPAMQTTQYWTKGVYVVNAGDQRVQIQQGLGYLIRNLVFINYTTGNLRNSTSDGNFPDPATLQFESTVLFDRLRTLWRDRIARDYGYTAAVETAGGYDFSVYPLPFNLDWALKPGADSRRGYLATADASRLEFRGNFGAAANFAVLANYVAPARGDDATITI